MTLLMPLPQHSLAEIPPEETLQTLNTDGWLQLTDSSRTGQGCHTPHWRPGRTVAAHIIPAFVDSGTPSRGFPPDFHRFPAADTDSGAGYGAGLPVDSFPAACLSFPFIPPVGA